MTGNQEGSRTSRGMKRSLNGRILRHTTFNILMLVVVCCVIMALSMQSLAKSILLDSLQPMARQSAKTMEANIHMLADRMMTIAADSRMNTVTSINGAEGEGTLRSNDGLTRENRMAVLEEAAEIYELYTIALYDLDGGLVLGIEDAPESLDGSFFGLLKETDNLTTDSSTIFQGKLGIRMGMPVKENGETVLYVVGVYKYDTINDVISSINLGKTGMAYMVNEEGIVTGHPDQSLALNKSTLGQLSGGNGNAAERVTTGETGASEYPVDGKQMLVAFSPIRGTQWSLVIQIPESDYSSLINGAMLVSVLATMAVLVISMLLVLRLARSISSPVKSVTGRMVALSDGDLHTEVTPVYSGDELEVMTQTLDATLESVNRYISDIQQVLTRVADGDLRTGPQVDYKGDFALIRSSLCTITGSMNETLLGFRGAAARLAEMAAQMNGQSAQLHQASLEQNRSTEELVHEVTHVKERLVDVTESSGQTRVQTEEITRRVQGANEQMEALSSAMDDISANAQQITKIAKDIEDIAFQTNILALNAAVEAAHAGEAGRGFAVVAEEVRSLAAESGEAVQSTSVLIGGSVQDVNTGTAAAGDVISAVQIINECIQSIKMLMDDLARASVRQSEMIVSVEEGIQEIERVVQTNSAVAEESAAVSRELSDQAKTLNSLIGQFRVQ